MSSPPARRGLHVAIIMDGNGRWATRRGLRRTAGHRAGAETLRRIVAGAGELGITTLTLYAFSSDNWRRPAAEVQALMTLFERFLLQEAARCRREGVRLSVIGRRDRLAPRLLRAIAAAESQTSEGRLHLRVAVDYSSRDAILAAAISPQQGQLDRDAFERSLERAMHSPPGVPPLDLLIRTGGEKRLSDFLLWESAYAELWFTDRLWPDFDRGELARAVADFRSRERRFGTVPVIPGAGSSSAPSLVAEG